MQTVLINSGMRTVNSPFKYSLVQEPVYHGTNQWFSNFSHSVDIGFHFGTESAANDRIGRVGVVEFDIEENLPESTPRFRSESVKRIYDLLVTKLQNPRKDLPDELNSMSDSELNDVYNEFSGAQSIQSTNASRPIGYTIKANGEALTTVDTESEAKYIMKQLTKWAKQPRKFWVDVQNPIRMPDLGTWGVGDIAKHARLTQPEIVELFDQDSSNRYEWLRDKLKAKGYDSIVYSNSVEDKGSDSYIVFDATQIKEIDKNHLMEAIYSAHPYKSPRHSELTPDEHNIRNTAYAIKKAGSPELVSAATDMAKYVNPQTILVPMPSSKGDVSANKELADAIAKISGASVVDAIGIKAPRVSNRDLELSGRTRLTAKKMGFVLRQSLDSRNVMFVDNVAASGSTIQAAQNLINGGDGLVYAKVEGIGDAMKPSAIKAKTEYRNKGTNNPTKLIKRTFTTSKNNKVDCYFIHGFSGVEYAFTVNDSYEDTASGGYDPEILPGVMYVLSDTAKKQKFDKIIVTPKNGPKDYRIISNIDVDEAKQKIIDTLASLQSDIDAHPEQYNDHTIKYLSRPFPFNTDIGQKHTRLNVSMPQPWVDSRTKGKYDTQRNLYTAVNDALLGYWEAIQSNNPGGYKKPRNRRADVFTPLIKRALPDYTMSELGTDAQLYTRNETLTESVDVGDGDELYPYDFPGDVYHVTYYRNLDSISEHGLLPNQQSSIGGIAYDEHRENKIFVCGAGDISYWYELAEEWAGDKSDDPMNDGFLPVILRVSCGDIYVDDAAVDDGCDESFYTIEPVGASDLELWVGGRWVPVDQYDGIDIARAFDEDGYFVRNNPYALIESIDSESLHAKFSQFIDSPDDIHYLGKGDFGEAYQISSDKVLKITTSKSEYELSKIQLDKKLSNLVTVYACFEYGSDYVIIMELLDQPQKIESLFYEVESIIETQGVDISNISYFDDDEYSSESGEIDTATTDFMNELSAVVYDYKRISEIPDIQPNNLGYDTNGVLKAFDLEDKAALRSNRR